MARSPAWPRGALLLAAAALLVVPAAALAQASVPIGGSCSSTAQCDDRRFCNGAERCLSVLFGGICVPGVPSCFGPLCNEALDRCETACTAARDCDDGLFCNGLEGCSGGRCRAGLPVDCDDRIACTRDACSEEERACRHISPDADGDGHGDARCFGDDCNDADSGRFPGNPEFCDGAGHDEDCDTQTFGQVDEDRDGHVAARCCNVTPGGGNCGTDCDDLEDGVHPGVPEVCNHVDDDCNDRTDEGVDLDLFPDIDGDEHGAAGELAMRGCPGDPGMSPLPNDCNDKLPAIQPGSLSCDPQMPDSALLCSSLGEFVPMTCAPGRCVRQPNGTGICQACDACTLPGDPLPPPP